MKRAYLLSDFGIVFGLTQWSSIWTCSLKAHIAQQASALTYAFLKIQSAGCSQYTFFSFWPFSWNCGYPASDVQLITRRELLDAKSFHSNREMGLNWRLQAWNEHRLNSLVLDFFHSDLTAYVSITVFSNF